MRRLCFGSGFGRSAAAVLALTLAVLVNGCAKKAGQDAASAADSAAVAGAAADAIADARDGKKYKTVKIGKQTWMAENLNYEPDSGNSWCYSDSASYCGGYGRLYDWNTAKTACPAGWKLPNTADWNKLAAAGGKEGAGKKLKSKSGWSAPSNGGSGNGTDIFGFSALPGGVRNTDGKFLLAGESGEWWTATEFRGGFAHYRGIYHDLDDIYVSENNNDMDEAYDYAESNGYSVRCVKE